jgi:hypothetical protein
MSQRPAKRRPRLTGRKGKYEPSVGLLYKMVRVDEETGCHLWTGTVNHGGYGRIGINYKDHLAHRLSFELQIGPIEHGLSVCHHCDTPRCINPKHLFLGKQVDNLADMVKKGRHMRGEGHYKSRLDQQKVRHIRSKTEPVDVLAAKYGVTKGAIFAVLNNKTWRHVT